MRKNVWIGIVAAMVILLGASGYCDELIFDGNTRQKGLTFVEDPEDAQNKVAIWKTPEKGYRTQLFAGEKDCSEYKAISIKFYSSVNDSSSIMVLCDSKDGNYFYKNFVVDWTGWKTVVIPLDKFTSSKTNTGWGSMVKIMLANNGYGGCKPSQTAKYYMDDVTLLTELPVEKETAEAE